MSEEHPYDEQTKYYEERECELQERIDTLTAQLAERDKRIVKLEGHIRDLHGLSNSGFPPLPSDWPKRKFYWRVWSREQLGRRGLSDVLQPDTQESEK